MPNLRTFITVSAFAASVSAFAHTYQGELEVLVFDDFKHNHSKTLYKLHESGQEYVLNLPKNVDENSLLTGMSVLIEGLEKPGLNEDKRIDVESLQIKKTESKEAMAPAYDTRKVLTLLVNFKDRAVTNTVSISNVDSILYTSPRSTKRNFEQSSFDQVSILRDTNNNGDPDIYPVTLDYAATNCDYSLWASDAKYAASLKGIDLSLYKHFMFVLPSSVSCSWGGLGNVGCTKTCNTWIKGYSPAAIYSQFVYTHELGHNMGMRHASTDTNNDGKVDSEYGDAACTMGAGNYNSIKEVNAPHRDQRGWFKAFPNRIQTVTTTGQYTLYPLEAGVSGGGLLAIKIPKKNSVEHYYVSYRKNIGVFGPGADAYMNVVSIHRADPAGGLTYFIKTLSPGMSFVDQANNITVSVLSAGGDTAVVSVIQ